MSRLERLLLFAGIGVIAWLLWRSRQLSEAMYRAVIIAGGTSGAGGPGGAGGAGGPGAAAGVAPGWPSFEAVAEAIRILAAGVEVPPLYSAFASVTGANLVELVPAEGSKRIYVASYAVTVGSECTLTFWSGNRSAQLWRLRLSPVTGTRSGANLAGAWPLPAFAPTNAGDALWIETTADAEVAVSYWRT